MKTEKNTKLNIATFAAGCFWHVEELFRTSKGVKSTSSGFVGGTVENPSYEDVCSGKTGHAEAVQVKFDSKEVSFEQLLEIFWQNHNPTTLNRQGFDFGEQYRSAIFYHSKEQKTAAEKSKEKLEKSGKHKNKIVTQIVPATTFFDAEEYHQKYLFKRNRKTC